MLLDPTTLRRRLRVASPPPIAGPPAEQQAAVFVVFVERHSDPAHVLLIRRADRGDPWSGQIAFPGGRIDDDDADPLAAAYRELGEEIGLHQGNVELLGLLGCFRTQTRPVDVHAFLGCWDGRATLRPLPSEVDELLELPLDALLASHHRAGFAGKPASSLDARLRYPLDDRTVWGVTARILHHLCERVLTPVA